jgi:hypothetical protein
MATKPINIGACMTFARTKLGKSFGSQVKDMFVLSRGRGKLRPVDYYYYGLYDDGRHDMAAKKRFISDEAHTRVIRRCCDIRYWGLGDDKLVAYTMLEGFGAPIPNTQAVYHRYRAFAGVPTLKSPEDLAGFLKGGARYPLFVKPSGGVQSVGVASINAFDAASGNLVLADGETIAVEDFAEHVGPPDADGQILQDRLATHPRLMEMCGDRVSTVRVMLILGDEGPEILATVWKITVGENIADNFWRPGNMLAAIDPESGRVTRVVEGVGPEQVEVEVHPDTHETLLGITLPDWERVKRLCMDCAVIFPQVRFQSWDIALCPDGPVIVEVNTGAAFSLSQVATGEGFLSDRFCQFLDSF